MTGQVNVKSTNRESTKENTYLFFRIVCACNQSYLKVSASQTQFYVP